jgi:hypothetical protein
MVLQGQLPKGILDGPGVGVARDAQHFIVIALHRVTSGDW